LFKWIDAVRHDFLVLVVGIYGVILEDYFLIDSEYAVNILALGTLLWTWHWSKQTYSDVKGEAKNQLLKYIFFLGVLIWLIMTYLGIQTPFF
jgi:hypothetical protein